MLKRKDFISLVTSSFLPEKLRIIRAAEQVKYQLSKKEKQIRELKKTGNYEMEQCSALTKFHLLLTSTMLDLYRNRSFDQAIKSKGKISCSEITLTDAVKMLKVATWEFIELIRKRLKRSPVDISYHADLPGTKPMPRYDSNFAELDILADIMNISTVKELRSIEKIYE